MSEEQTQKEPHPKGSHDDISKSLAKIAENTSNNARYLKTIRTVVVWTFWIGIIGTFLLICIWAESLNSISAGI